MATAAAQLTTNEIFNLIRGQEANFPFPVPQLTVTVGKFDAATGKFVYAVPTYTEEFENPLPGKPPKILTGGKINAIGAIEVFLRFDVKNRTGDVTVSIPGLPAVRSSTDSVTVSIGLAELTKFTISSGARKFTSELPLEITRFVGGAGVFELPAFPIAIIYAPPQDQSQKNVSQWTVTQSTGNTSTLSISDSKTTTTPATPDFDNVNLIADEMKVVAQALDLLNEAFEDKGVKIISKALNIIAGGLGSSSASNSEGVSINKDHSVTLSLSKEQTISTSPASGGPGSGDLIHYLKNVKLVWFSTSVGHVRVSIIGHDGLGVTSVGFLKNGGQTDLDPATVAEFLKLDPFVAGGPSTTLPKDRFVYLDTIDLNGGEISLTECHSVSETESKQTVSTRTHIQKNQPGFLKFLGLGVTDEKSTETVIKQSSAVQSEEARKICNSIHLFARPDERYSVEVYCDVVFGTFAYRQVRSVRNPLVQGTTFGLGGKVLARKTVTLINEGRKFTTRTDAAGRYAFHASTIKPGKFQVSVEGIKKTRTLSALGAKFDIRA
jgi:hypothetical protein